MKFPKLQVPFPTGNLKATEFVAGHQLTLQKMGMVGALRTCQVENKRRPVTCYSLKYFMIKPLKTNQRKEALRCESSVLTWLSHIKQRGVCSLRIPLQIPP